MSTDTPESAAILKDMLRQAEHILQRDWPAGMDMSRMMRACSPKNIRAVAAYVKALEAENAELKDMLRDMVEDSGGLANECGRAFRDNFEALRNRARAALNTEGE